MQAQPKPPSPTTPLSLVSAPRSVARDPRPPELTEEHRVELTYQCEICHKDVDPFWSRGTRHWMRGKCECVYQRELARELLRERQEWQKTVGLKGRNAGYMLDNFDAGDENRNVYAAVKAYAQTLINTFTAGLTRDGLAEDRNLVLSSKTPGVGKTMLAAGIANALLDEAYAAKSSLKYGELSHEVASALRHLRWYKAPDMHTAAINDKDNFNRSLRAQVFFIDDVGKDAAKEEWLHRLYWTILEERTNRGLPTVITTNLTAPELEAFIGNAAFDRLDESGSFLIVQGASFRRGGMKAIKG